MIIDWGAVLTGFGVGVVISTLFFASLALAMRLALRSLRPVAVLLSSAAVRIGLLLWVGWQVTNAATDGWALAGYALAFFLVRFIATMIARPPRSPGTVGHRRSDATESR